MATPAPGWRPDKGMREPGVVVRPVVALSQAQCDKLAELSAPLGPTQRLWIQQTVSDTGGTHLYVRRHTDDSEWHVGVNGNAIKLGLVERNSLEHRRVVERDEEAENRKAVDQRKADREAEELAIARRVIDRYGPPPPGEGTHPLQRHRDSMG